MNRRCGAEPGTAGSLPVISGARGVAVGSRPSNPFWQPWDGGRGTPGQTLVVSLCVWAGSGGLTTPFVPAEELAFCYLGEQHFPFSCLDTFARIALPSVLERGGEELFCSA